MGEGDTVQVGGVIMKGEAAGDDGGKAEAEPAAAQDKSAGEAKPAGEAEPPRRRSPQRESQPQPEPRRPEPLPPSPAAAPPAPAADAPIDLQTVRTGDQVAPAAPSVRRLARELGVDIYQVQGTGPGGRISEDDVRTFVRTTMQRITGGGPAPAVTGEFPGLHAQRPLPDFSKWGGVTVEPLSPRARADRRQHELRLVHHPHGHPGRRGRRHRPGGIPPGLQPQGRGRGQAHHDRDPAEGVRRGAAGVPALQQQPRPGPQGADPQGLRARRRGRGHPGRPAGAGDPRLRHQGHRDRWPPS